MKMTKRLIKNRKINRMKLETLESVLRNLKHKTYNDRKGRVINCSQDNSLYAKHIKEQIKVFEGK